MLRGMLGQANPQKLMTKFMIDIKRCTTALAAGLITTLGAVGPAQSALPETDPPEREIITQAMINEHFPKTTSVLVSRDGTLVYERYFKGGKPEKLNDTRSAMKSVTALAMGIALEEGVFPNVDAPVFPWLAADAPYQHDGPLKQQITLADFLTMSSALNCNDWDMENPGNEENMYPKDDWSRWAVDIPLKEDYQRDLRGRGPFSYCTGGVFLLGQALQAASKTAVDDWIAEKLFRPLGINHWQWPRSPDGEVQTGGGLRLRSRDLVNLGQMVLQGGEWNGQQLVPGPWVELILRPVHRVDEQQSYGYLFWIRDYNSSCGTFNAWYMSGNGGNVVVGIEELDMVIVVTREHYGQRGMHQQTAELIEKHLLQTLACNG